MTTEELELFRKLLRKLQTTKASRFEAYRRIRRRKLSSTVSVAFLSLSIICFNICQLLPGFEQYNNSISAVTIMLSSMVLVLSLLISNMCYGERELKYYQCSTRFSQLEDKLNIFLESPRRPDLRYDEIYQTYFHDYHQIIEECGINHITKDYHKTKWNASGDDQNKLSWWQKSWYWIEWNILDVNTIYWLMAIIIPFIAGFVIFHLNTFSPQ